MRPTRSHHHNERSLMVAMLLINAGLAVLIGLVALLLEMSGVMG